MSKDTGSHEVIDTASAIRAHQLVVLRHTEGISTHAGWHSVKLRTSYQSHTFEIDRPDDGPDTVSLRCPSCNRSIAVTVRSVAASRRTRRLHTGLRAAAVAIAALSLIGAIAFSVWQPLLITGASLIALFALAMFTSGPPKHSGLAVEDPGHAIWMKRTAEDGHPDDDW